MNFQNISERGGGGGGGVISDLKNVVANYFALERAILVMNFREEKLPNIFTKKGRGARGGQRLLNLFLKIHLFWRKLAFPSFTISFPISLKHERLKQLCRCCDNKGVVGYLSAPPGYASPSEHSPVDRTMRFASPLFLTPVPGTSYQ